MPIADFKCIQCGDVREILYKLSNPPQPACSKCGGAVEQQIGAPGFVLTGTGFCNRGRGSAGST
jgi:putative FmdB family regulatory protein